MTYLAVDLNSIASVAYYTDNFLNFFTMLMKAQNAAGTKAIVFAADWEGHYWRHQIYPEYKGNRDPEPERNAKISKLHRALIMAGYPVIAEKGLEADDILASLPQPNIIFSRDSDLWQLYPKSNILTLDYTFLTDQVCLDRFGVKTSNLASFKALAGDTGDNLPGVTGIGKVWAARLLNEYGSLGNIYNNLADLPDGIANKLKSADVKFWYNLVALKTVNIPSVQPKTVTDNFKSVVGYYLNGS